MDAKNLAVLMKLKALMSSEKPDAARCADEPAEMLESELRVRPSPSKRRDQAGHSRRRDQRSIYRGVDVGVSHYQALVEAVSSTSTANIRKKLEALAFYLTKAPDDSGALKAFDRLFLANITSPRKVETAKPSQKTSSLRSDIQIRAECSKCRSVYAVSFGQVPPSWVCKSCQRLQKIAKQDEAQALTDQQYASGAGSYVRQIETKIASLRAILESESIENPRGLMLQISQLEKRLKLEKAHAISGFRKIRAHQVPGSYGSNR